MSKVVNDMVAAARALSANAQREAEEIRRAFADEMKRKNEGA